MPRIKLELPDRFPFSTEMPIRIGDINYGGHLGNDAVLSLIHEARVRFLRHHGYSEIDIEGVSIIMADAVIVYKSEGFYGDLLTIEVAVANIESRGCDFFFRLTNKQSDKEVAVAKTGIIFFDYKKRKPVRVPEGFVAKVLPA